MREKIVKWHVLGLWTADMVRSAVAKGGLTEDESVEVLVHSGGDTA